MKFLFSNEWARRQIAADPDTDISAGPALEDLLAQIQSAAQPEESQAVLPDRNVVQLRMALGTVVRGLRLKRQLSIAQLANNADVIEDELRQVEHNPNYTAHPRLISQLSMYFGVPLSELSGTRPTVDRALYNVAVKYAARADDLLTVTAEEQRALDAFITILHQRAQLTERG